LSGEDIEIAAAGAEIDFVVGNEGRSPGFAFDVVSPNGFPSFGIEAMEHPAAVGNEEKIVGNGWCGHDVFLESVAPEESVGRNVASFSRINALEPGFVLAPPEVAAAGEVDAVAIEDGHRVEVARAFPSIAVVAVDVVLGGGRVEVESEDVAEQHGGWSEFDEVCLQNGVGVLEGGRSGFGIFDGWEFGGVFGDVKGVEDAIASGEEEIKPVVHEAKRGR